jgi:hypothetical protein
VRRDFFCPTADLRFFFFLLLALLALAADTSGLLSSTSDSEAEPIGLSTIFLASVPLVAATTDATA